MKRGRRIDQASSGSPSWVTRINHEKEDGPRMDGPKDRWGDGWGKEVRGGWLDVGIQRYMDG